MVVEIFDEFYKQRNCYFSKKTEKFDFMLKEALGGCLKELDEQLEAIN